LFIRLPLEFQNIPQKNSIEKRDNPKSEIINSIRLIDLGKLCLRKHPVLSAFETNTLIFRWKNANIFTFSPNINFNGDR